MKKVVICIAFALSIINPLSVSPSSSGSSSSYAYTAACVAGACAAAAGLYKAGSYAYRQWAESKKRIEEQRIIDQVASDLGLLLMINTHIAGWPEELREDAFCRKAWLVNFIWQTYDNAYARSWRNSDNFPFEDLIILSNHIAVELLPLFKQILAVSVTDINQEFTFDPRRGTYTLTQPRKKLMQVPNPCKQYKDKDRALTPAEQVISQQFADDILLYFYPIQKLPPEKTKQKKVLKERWAAIINKVRVSLKNKNRDNKFAQSALELLDKYTSDKYAFVEDPENRGRYQFQEVASPVF